MSDLPAPLTPADCDLRDFQFMPLDVRRLRDSDLAALETPEACWAAVLLWGAAWDQVPAGSLPNDDRILAQFTGYGRVVKEWTRVRDGALRGFVECDDGRLYHPVVAEKAIEAWNSKLQQRWKTECARIKKHNERGGQKLPTPTFERFLEARRSRPVTGDSLGVSLGTVDDVPRDSADSSEGQTADVPSDNPPLSPRCPSGNGIQGTGIGTGILGSEDKSSDADGVVILDLDQRAWSEAVKVLTSQGALSDKAARRLFGKLLSDSGIEAKSMLPAIAGALVGGTGDPQAFLAKAAKNLARRSSVPPAVAALKSNIQ